MAEVGNSNLFHLETGILPKDAFVVIVRTEWNAAVVDKLEEGCKRILTRQGIPFRVVTVPGAFEVAFGIRNYWDRHHQNSEKRPAAFIALACVIRGGTPHFDYVCRGITDGIVQLNLSLPVPTVFGVLTVDSQEQAEERTGGIHGHKGEEAALTAIKMMDLKD